MVLFLQAGYVGEDVESILYKLLMVLFIFTALDFPRDISSLFLVFPVILLQYIYVLVGVWSTSYCFCDKIMLCWLVCVFLISTKAFLV